MFAAKRNPVLPSFRSPRSGVGFRVSELTVTHLAYLTVPDTPGLGLPIDHTKVTAERALNFRDG